ncbi:MAG: hypothetical protein ACI9F9_002351 [Candidatus Paceibacteria bacterium]|jgi:hypothetical protein
MGGLLQGFVNPFLLAGLGLTLVPIVIHLLNRQRHKPMPWGAMRFVLAAYKQTRRRVRLENWLLLFLRVLAVAAIALAVARPYTGSDGPLASLTESRRDLAIVIDGSASTGYRSEVDTVFERVIERARELAVELDGTRGDRCHLILAGSWPRLLAWGDPSNALAALELLTEATDEDLNLTAALGEVLEFASEEAANTQESRLEVRLLTDMQRGAFTTDTPSAVSQEATPAAATGDVPSPDSQGSLALVLDQLRALGLRVQVEDLSDGDSLPPNLSVQSIDLEGPWLGVGVPVDVRVRIKNHGQAPKLGIRVALEIDGVRRPSQVLDIQGSSQAEAIFPTVFESIGDHGLVVHLEGDRLAIDDQRSQIVYVPAPVKVLIVNGAPHPDFNKDAASRLAVVLQPALAEDSMNTARAPFEPTVIEPADLENGELDLTNHEVIWLANVASLSEPVIRALEKHVAAGATLVMSLGDRVQRELFNRELYRLDGSGLAPAEIGELVAVASRRTSYYRISDFDSSHASLSLFAEDRWKSLLTEAPFYEFYSTRPLEQTQVLARLDDQALSPLFMEREYDRGRVLMWTSSMDETWTGFPSWGPALVPFVYDLVRDAGRADRPSHAIAPGGTFITQVTSFPRSMELVTPEDARRTIDADAVELDSGNWQLPAITGNATARTGLYKISTDGAGEHLFAVQLPARESALERLTAIELEAIHPGLEALSKEAATATSNGLPAGRGELWRSLAMLALLALVGESLWSAWIGRRRRVA